MEKFNSLYVQYVKEMREAQIAFSLFPSGDNRRKKIACEKKVDQILDERERGIAQSKQEMLPL
jgi:hypothetical protein